MIKPIQDNNSIFESVILKTDRQNIKETPHCINHGAMNKVSSFKDSKGGYWRCCTTENTVCRSGCIEYYE